MVVVRDEVGNVLGFFNELVVIIDLMDVLFDVVVNLFFVNGVSEVLL